MSGSTEIAEERRPNWTHRLAVDAVSVLIAAAIGGGAAAWGAHEGANATSHATNAQLQAARDQAAREQRASVYDRYLSAASNYRLKDQTLVEWLHAHKTNPSGEFAVDVTSGPAKSFYTAQQTYVTATNQLYVYGSDAAWNAHLQLASALPPTTFSFDDSISPDSTFETVYHNFQRVFCEEAPAEPRQGC